MNKVFSALRSCSAIMVKVMLFTVACLTFASCKQSEIDSDNLNGDSFKKGQVVKLIARSQADSPDTKVTSEFNGGIIEFSWEEGDEILVIVGQETSVFTLTKGAGTAVGEFEGTMPAAGNTFDIHYPAVDPDLTNQVYISSEALPHNLVRFKAEGCVVQNGSSVFQIDPYDCALRMELTGKDKMVGKIVLKSTDATPAFTYTLDCGTGVALDETTPTPFCAVVPLGTYNISAEVYNENDELVCSYATAAAVEFSNKTCVAMTAKEVKPTEQTILFKKSGSVVAEEGTNFLDATYSAPKIEGASTTITYKSSNEAVATVASDGTVTILAPGTVEITAIAAATSQYTADTTSYTLKVYGCYTKINTLSEIVDNGTYIITNTADDKALAGVLNSGEFLNNNAGNTVTGFTKQGEYIVDSESLKPAKMVLSSTGVEGSYSIYFTDAEKYFSPRASSINYHASESSMSNTVASSASGFEISANGRWINCISNFGTSTSASYVSLWKYINKTVPVTAITLNKTTSTINKGENDQLSVTAVTPADATDQTYTWSSSDESIATVDATGKVTAVSGGTVTITCKANGGTDVKATCSVTVAASVPVTSITLNKSTATMRVDSTLTLSVTEILPSNATDKTYSWSSGDNTKATVDATGKVTALKAGTVTITCTASDGSGVTKSCSITINDNPYFQQITGLSQLSSTETYIITCEDEGVTYVFAGLKDGNKFLEEDTGNAISATVTSGKITDIPALANCKVTIKNVSGSNYSIYFQAAKAYFSPMSDTRDFDYNATSPFSCPFTYSSNSFIIRQSKSGESNLKYLIFQTTTNTFAGSKADTSAGETNYMKIWKRIDPATL